MTSWDLEGDSDVDGGRTPVEYLRTTRIIQIIQMITGNPGRHTRRSLASEFEISERQITKDLNLIRNGLLFELDRKPGGGYFFRRIPKLPAVSYTLPEALAIFLAARAGRSLAGIPQAELAKALAALTAIMPSEMQPLLERNNRSGPAPARNEHREQILEILSRAIAARCSVDLIYHAASRGGEATTRRVDPYEIMPYGHSWHLIGWCHLRRAVRIFKVDRIERAMLTQASFTFDPNFDLAEFLSQGWGLMRGTSQAAEEVVLLFSATAGRWVAEEQWHPSQVCEWLDDGRLRFRVSIPVTDEFSRWVLRYGNDCEVAQPAHLRGWIADQARALLDRYQPSYGSRRPLDSAAG